MKQQFIKLLESLNNNHDSPLVEKDIVDYVTHIFDNATIKTIMDNDRLIAFIAYYDNDLTKKDAFLSMIAVDFDYRSKGYGKLLLNEAISKLKKLGFVYFNLEVLKQNKVAIAFYKKYNFSIVKELETKYYMQKVI